MHKIWVDIINPSDAFFLNSMVSGLDGCEFVYTLRDRSETVALSRSMGMDGPVVPSMTGNQLFKALNLPYRCLRLFGRVPEFSASISFGNIYALSLSKLHRKPAIVFVDNDLALKSAGLWLEKIYKWCEFHAAVAIVPECFFLGRYEGGKNIIKYDGVKEDIYVANYRADPEFLSGLPFSEYVVVRPEALFAAYVHERHGLVREILMKLSENGMNVIFLPRTDFDRTQAEGIDVYMPEQSVNGLDLCRNAQAVLSGSGTLAREAACMGVPAVSFFPHQLLSVDEYFVNNGEMFHSRSADDIVQYVKKHLGKRHVGRIQRARDVREYVIAKTRAVLDGLGMG